MKYTEKCFILVAIRRRSSSTSVARGVLLGDYIALKMRGVVRPHRQVASLDATDVSVAGLAVDMRVQPGLFRVPEGAGELRPAARLSWSRVYRRRFSDRVKELRG